MFSKLIVLQQTPNSEPSFLFITIGADLEFFPREGVGEWKMVFAREVAKVFFKVNLLRMSYFNITREGRDPEPQISPCLRSISFTVCLISFSTAIVILLLLVCFSDSS